MANLILPHTYKEIGSFRELLELLGVQSADDVKTNALDEGFLVSTEDVGRADRGYNIQASELAGELICGPAILLSDDEFERFEDDLWGVFVYEKNE